MKSFTEAVKSVMIGESQGAKQEQEQNLTESVNWANRIKQIENAIPVLKGNLVDSEDDGDEATLEYDLSKLFGKAFKDFTVTVYAGLAKNVSIDIDAHTAGNQGVGTARPFKVMI